MMNVEPAKTQTEFATRFQSILGRNLVFHMVPPITLCIISIILFCCFFRSEFHVGLAVISATIALLHGSAVLCFFQRDYPNSVIATVNFLACLAHLALLTYSFFLHSDLERGRGIALLIVGSALILNQRPLFIAFAVTAIAASVTMFQITGIGVSGRDVLYVGLVPAIIGYFACHSRENLFLHLNQLFEEKKSAGILLEKALADAQEELRLREESDGKLAVANRAFDRLLDVIPQVHWVRQEDQVTFISPSFEQVWESNCKELCVDFETFFKRVHPNDLHSVRGSFEANRCRGEVDHEFRLVMEDGRTKWIHARSYIDPDDHLTEFGVAEDITAKKATENAVKEKNAQLHKSFEELQAETILRRNIEAENLKIQEKLARSQRLESLSLMAGGIAHDFNNILMAILINLDLLRIDIQQNRQPDLQRIQDIEKSSTRAADICQQMLQFSGRAPTELQRVNLGLQIADAIQILHSTIPENVSVQFNDSPDHFYTLGMPAQIQQVILNLVTNALEAVGDMGQIDLSVSTGFFDNEQLGSTYLDSPDPMTEFHIVQCCDSGCGMDDVTLKKLFDPFFSSKNNGRGLGLASVLGIVKGHGGTIVVESTLGIGTQFRIYFPAYFGESDFLTGEAAAKYVSEISAS